MQNLQALGEHRQTQFYVNHYGNLPTHCPPWANMNLAKKTSTQLGVMKATQPLSDKSIETDPNKVPTV